MTLEEYKPSSVKSMIVEQPAECDSTPAHSGKFALPAPAHPCLSEPVTTRSLMVLSRVA